MELHGPGESLLRAARPVQPWVADHLRTTYGACGALNGCGARGGCGARITKGGIAGLRDCGIAGLRCDRDIVMAASGNAAAAHGITQCSSSARATRNAAARLDWECTCSAVSLKIGSTWSSSVISCCPARLTSGDAGKENLPAAELLISVWHRLLRIVRWQVRQGTSGSST